MSPFFKKHGRPAAVTLIELLVVVLIIGLLATIASGVYVGEVRRARIAATEDLIRQLEMAITRYEVDTGDIPPSGSSEVIPPQNMQTGGASTRQDGSGLLHLALVHSLSGNAYDAGTGTWNGPYINFQDDQLAADEDIVPANIGSTNILDPFGNPVIYVRSEDYTRRSEPEFTGGSRLFATTPRDPELVNPRLPAPNPYVAQGETFYNTRTYQIISFGPNGTSLDEELQQLGIFSFKGADFDDITNFGY